MSKNKLTTLIVSILCLIKPLWASDLNYWECATSDSEGKQWTAKSDFKRAATSRSFDDCKKQSRVPSSCKASHEACEWFNNGVTTQPMWQCTALDQMATPWVSIPYPHAEDAAIAAKAYCRERSSSPNTCFTYLLMCKNLNALS